MELRDLSAVFSLGSSLFTSERAATLYRWVFGGDGGDGGDGGGGGSLDKNKRGVVLCIYDSFSAILRERE